jgi:putative SOS response-associated peptidase YedK
MTDDPAAVAETRVREEIAQRLGPDALQGLGVQVELYTPAGTSEPLLSVRLTPLDPRGHPRGAAWPLRAVTTPDELASAVREMTRRVLHQLRPVGWALKGNHMCGRYGFEAGQRELLTRFQIEQVVEQLPISFNVVPGMTMPVVVRESPNRLELMEWGFLPRWAKEPRGVRRPINARAETVATTPMFRNAFRSQRCLVPARGFYEWQQTPSGKQPYWIRLPGGELFGFAGLWEAWRDRHGEEVRSYTIITTAPNELMAPIHNRMPVILPRDAEELWLNPDETEGERLRELLRPYDASEMEAWPVGRAVNNPRNDSPELISPSRR